MTRRIKLKVQKVAPLKFSGTTLIFVMVMTIAAAMILIASIS